MFRFLWARPALLLVLATLFWSGNFVLGRALHLHVPPVGLSFWRWVLAFSIVSLFAWRHVRADWPELRGSLPILAVLAFLGVATFNTLVYQGLHTTTAVNAVLLQSTMPVLIFLGSFLLFGESVRVLQVLALMVSLCGVAVIVSGGSWDALRALAIAPGDAWVFAAVVLYALYSVLLRRRPQVHPLSFLAATFGLGTLMLCPVWLWEEFTRQPLHLDGETLVAIAYVGIFPSILSYLCFNRAVELIGPNRAGQFVHLMPVFGTALSALFLGESLHGFHLAGAALIAAGIVLNQRAAARPARR